MTHKQGEDPRSWTAAPDEFVEDAYAQNEALRRLLINAVLAAIQGLTIGQLVAIGNLIGIVAKVDLDYEKPDEKTGDQAGRSI